MAQKYRKIDPRIWADERFDRLGAREALAAFWVLTNANRAGLVHATTGSVSDHLRCDSGTEAEQLLAVTCESMGWPMCRSGRTGIVILVPKWFRYNEPTNADHLRGCLKDLADIPRCEVLEQVPLLADELTVQLKPIFIESITPCPTPCGTPCETPCGTSEAEAEAETEAKARTKAETKTERQKAVAQPVSLSSGFEGFWKNYPNPVSKSEAEPEYAKALQRLSAAASGPEDPQAHIEQAAASYAAHVASEGIAVRYVPKPSTWLSQARYDDVLKPTKRRRRRFSDEQS